LFDRRCGAIFRFRDEVRLGRGFPSDSDNMAIFTFVDKLNGGDLTGENAGNRVSDFGRIFSDGGSLGEGVVCCFSGVGASDNPFSLTERECV
jgi:hypothetical protein